MKKILLIFTGGTICSCPVGENNKNQSNAKGTASYLEEGYKNSSSPFKNQVGFIRRFLTQDILSENMTVNCLSELIDIFKDKDLIEDCAGAIVLHGTDTLAYTSSLLSLALAGLEIPVCMVSAQLDLKQEKTNGYDNFKAAVELIMNGIAPNVYVVYRNLLDSNHKAGKMLVHFGAHLLQCPNHSNNFHSYDEMEIPDLSNACLKGLPFETKERLFDRLDKLTDGVMQISPYTNLRYSNISLDGVCAVVHGTYHSGSVCIGRAKEPDIQKERNLTYGDVAECDKPYSILGFLDKCKEKDIPLFLAPCDENDYRYGTTANALHCGAWAIPNTTSCLAYAKMVLGCSLGIKGDELRQFASKSINREFVYENRHKDL